MQPARVNSAQQFADSPDFDEAVQGVVADNQSAHTTMADYLSSDASGREQLVMEIAEWFYQLATGRKQILLFIEHACAIVRQRLLWMYTDRGIA